MGREIRRVPGDWEHPRYTAEDAPRSDRVGDFHPLYDKDYETACEEWYREAAAWAPEKSVADCRWYHEYAGDPPSESYYRARKWTADEATHYAVYETVSEGTPVTPALATKEDLIVYLAEHGDFWDQKRGSGPWGRASAERFVKSEWAPSLMILHTSAGTRVSEPRDGGIDA